MPAKRWRSRWRTAEAAMMLGRAQLTIATMPFKRWRNTLGREGALASNDAVAEAMRLAAHVEWAAKRLPFVTKCLPRAMALSWMLRSRNIGHSVVIAARPAEMRATVGALHAWVEVEGTRIIGDLPGPWIDTWRSGDTPVRVTPDAD